MKKTLLAICIGTALLYACNNSNESTEAESTTAEDAASQTTEPSTAVESAQMQNADSSNGSIVTNGTPETNIQPTAATAEGMNPPHGQPGHRCEIPVGAPLNSAPTTAPANNSGSVKPAISTTPMTSIPAPTSTSAPAQTAHGMNPPHGQPGHDCAIAVGAPLKK